MTTPIFSDDGVNTSTGGTKPSYSSRKTSKPIVNNIRFADGFEQRQIVGIPAHQNPRIYNLTFEKSKSDGDKIDQFLNARANNTLGALQSFDFTPPGESTSSKFVCEGWNITIPYVNRVTIQATFREVFEP